MSFCSSVCLTLLLLYFPWLPFKLLTMFLFLILCKYSLYPLSSTVSFLVKSLYILSSAVEGTRQNIVRWWFGKRMTFCRVLFQLSKSVTILLKIISSLLFDFWVMNSNSSINWLYCFALGPLEYNLTGFLIAFLVWLFDCLIAWLFAWLSACYFAVLQLNKPLIPKVMTIANTILFFIPFSP